MNYQTPGVYTQEISKLPPGVAGVATAIPAFIGFTEFSAATAVQGTAAIDFQPEIKRIGSLLEYEAAFGGANEITYTVEIAQNTTTQTDTVNAVTARRYLYLYTSVKLYFQNGGGPCYIVSIGDYIMAQGDHPVVGGLTSTVALKAFNDALTAVEEVDEVTLLLAPDALMQENGKPFFQQPNPTAPVPKIWDDAEYGTLANNMLAHCAKLQDRFCIFDVLRGYESPSEGVIDGSVTGDKDGFRSVVNGENYGAAYYPWVNRVEVAPLRFDQLFLRDANNLPLAPYDPDGLMTKVGNWTTTLNSLRVFLRAGTPGPSATPFTQPMTVDGMWSHYQQLRQTYEDAAGPVRKPAFTRWMLSLVTVASAFRKVETALPELGSEINQLLGDGLLIQQIVKLCEFIQLMKTDNVTSAPPLNEAETLDTHDWLLINATDYPDVASIQGEVSYQVTATTPALKREEAIRFLEHSGEINLNKLFSAYARLVEAATFHHQNAERDLFANHPVFAAAKADHERQSRLAPSQGAIAGIYAATDRERGVWKAPANVSLNGISGPALLLSNVEQDTLNVDPTTGKSINALRAFSGKGTLIWGARTLTGNDSEWRYVPVRRFFLFVEESISKASQPFVFEPNNAVTWVRVKAMITNFLINQWKAGALQGNQAEDAFFVKVGLGQTMSEQDVLDGKMIVEVGLAAVRPAEFIVLRFTHHMTS